jgi:hypothetical protein
MSCNPLGKVAVSIAERFWRRNGMFHLRKARALLLLLDAALTVRVSRPLFALL